MADPKGQEHDHSGMVFAAHNNHDPRCGRSPCLRKTANPALHYAYFENRYGRRIVFTLDPATSTGTVSSGHPGWDDPKAFLSGSWTRPSVASRTSPLRS
jgi:hypothetical protein